MEAKLCPMCGAYWSCDCVIEPPPREQLAPLFASTEPMEIIAAPPITQAAGCDHDWTEVVGVELDEDAAFGEAQVLVCRLCGLYAVEKSA